jgi:hypothetical protein
VPELWTPPALSDRDEACIESLTYPMARMGVSPATFSELRGRVYDWNTADPTVPPTLPSPLSRVVGVEVRLERDIEDGWVRTPAGLILLDKLLPAVQGPPAPNPIETELAREELRRFQDRHGAHG